MDNNTQGVLVISRPVEFGKDNAPVRGQCQPHLKGWQLFLFHRGERSLLFTDNFYTCRKLMEGCRGKSTDEIHAYVDDFSGRVNCDLEETKTVELSSEETADYNTRANAPAGGGDSATVVIPKEEMEDELRKRGGDS